MTKEIDRKSGQIRQSEQAQKCARATDCLFSTDQKGVIGPRTEARLQWAILAKLTVEGEEKRTVKQLSFVARIRLMFIILSDWPA